MEIPLNAIESITEISSNDFNVRSINSIKKEYGALRDISKAPT